MASRGCCFRGPNQHCLGYEHAYNGGGRCLQYDRFQSASVRVRCCRTGQCGDRGIPQAQAGFPLRSWPEGMGVNARTLKF